MAVLVFLTSGGNRMIPEADAARADGPFFVITRRHPISEQIETVLTLRTQDVIRAEIMKDGTVIDRVLGGDGLSR